MRKNTKCCKCELSIPQLHNRHGMPSGSGPRYGVSCSRQETRLHRRDRVNRADPWFYPHCFIRNLRVAGAPNAIGVHHDIQLFAHHGFDVDLCQDTESLAGKNPKERRTSDCSIAGFKEHRPSAARSSMAACNLSRPCVKRTGIASSFDILSPYGFSCDPDDTEPSHRNDAGGIL